MTLEDRLEQLADRTLPGDPGDVLARARVRAASRSDGRNPRFVAAAAAAVVVAVSLVAGALALTGGDDSESTTVAGPDRTPAQPQPSCDEITRFAESLDATGIDYDYSASSSPQDLASRSDAVFAGTLTDTVTEATDDESRVDHVGFDVKVTDRFKSGELPTGDTVTVLLQNGGGRPADDWADLVAPGAPILVFAHTPAEDVSGAGVSVVANGVEGIITACEDGPPLGLVGTQGDWPTFDTLGDIEAALRSGADAADGVSVAVDDLGPVAASVSPLSTSEPGWLEHTVTFENTGGTVVHMQDFRSGTLLGEREVAAATEGCAWDSLAGPRCNYEYRPVTIEPGGTHTVTVTLWRDLTGMNPIGDGPHEWRLLIDQRNTPFDHPDQTGATGTLTLTYRDLALRGEGTVADTIPEPNGGIRDADAERIVSDFLRLADDPSAEAAERLPFAEEMRLGLGSELHKSLNRSELADPAAWIIDGELFRAYTGPFSALDVAAGADGQAIVVSVGDHPHCASPPMAPPDDLVDLTRVSVQPDSDEIDSCLQWWTVDFFVNDDGRIEAVTLDLWEP